MIARLCNQWRSCTWPPEFQRRPICPNKPHFGSDLLQSRRPIHSICWHGLWLSLSLRLRLVSFVIRRSTGLSNHNLHYALRAEMAIKSHSHCQAGDIRREHCSEPAWLPALLLLLLAVRIGSRLVGASAVCASLPPRLALRHQTCACVPKLDARLSVARHKSQVSKKKLAGSRETSDDGSVSLAEAR